MSIFPRTFVGNAIAFVTAGGILLVAASRGWPVLGTSAVIYIAADILVVIVRALSWLFDDRPVEPPEIRITVTFKDDEEQ